MGMDIEFYSTRNYTIVKDTEQVHFNDQLHMAEELWNMACNMASNENPQLHFSYYRWELHFPLCCGYHTTKPVMKEFIDVGTEDMSGFIMTQLADCLDYVDNEFAFYKSFFSDDATKVFLSDHSHVVCDEEECKPYYMYYNDLGRSVHCPLIISGNKVPTQIDDRPFSLIDFNTVMASLVRGETLDVPTRDVVRYEYYSVHNKVYRDLALKNGYQDYIEGIYCFLTPEYLFVHTGTGREEAYRLDNPKRNVIDTAEGRTLAERIKQDYDLTFPEFA